MGNEEALREFLKTHNYIRNNKSVRKRLNLSIKQLKDLIDNAVQQQILVLYNPGLWQVNREKLSLQREITTPIDKTVEATEKLRQYLKGQIQLKNITSVRSSLNISYVPMLQAIKQLEEEGILAVVSLGTNNQRTFHVNHHSLV
jgi:hypothetical protein